VAELTADDRAEHLQRCGFVMMRRPLIGDYAGIARGPPEPNERPSLGTVPPLLPSLKPSIDPAARALMGTTVGSALNNADEPENDNRCREHDDWGYAINGCHFPYDIRSKCPFRNCAGHTRRITRARVNICQHRSRRGSRHGNHQYAEDRRHRPPVSVNPPKSARVQCRSKREDAPCLLPVWRFNRPDPGRPYTGNGILDPEEPCRRDGRHRQHQDQNGPPVSVWHVSKQPEAARREALRNSGEKFRGFVYHRISTKDTETTTIPLAIIPHQKTGQNRSIIGRQRRVRGAVSRLCYEPRSRASAIRRSLAVTTTAGLAAVAGFIGLLRFGFGG
jgi:hypothetical protein